MSAAPSPPAPPRARPGLPGALVRAARIAGGDVRGIMGRPAYWVAALGPALLAAFVATLVLLAAVALSLVQASDPEVNPMGTTTVAVVGMGALSPPQRAVVEAMMADAPALEAEPRGTLGWFRRGQLWLARVRGEDGDAAPVVEREPIRWQPVDEGRAAVAPGIPDRWDAALILSPGDGGPPTFEILSEPAILYSRVMETRLAAVIRAFNAHGDGPGPPVDVEDRPRDEVDPWPLYALLALVAVGAAYTYHGVAVQSVASVLAGERERRTLEVLLSLPIHPRELVWGKLLALVVAIMVPASLWTGAAAWGAGAWLGISAPLGRLLLLAAAVVLPLTAVGCAISATAPTLQAAQNRLGLANLGVLVLSVAGFVLLERLGLGAVEIAAGLLDLASGAPAGLAWAGALVCASVAVAAALVEVSARLLRPTP